ncbi:GNAT family N-acetyltransferase [Alteribacter aurantiacus]|uniref:GNAT family N-acetyltransferase n=1 Tax=Alteribacter aurantiacus TaxID=254410 RepID=UPI0004270093|nr:GNAT family N-acetyltransferase [Alteribacter aurantiacus]
MQLHPLQEERLDDMVALWNEELHERFPMRKALFLQNSFHDQNVDQEASRLAITDEGHVAGFIVAKRWQEKMTVSMPKSLGWIQVLLVSSKYQNQGVGTRLLHHAETTLQEAGAEELVLGRDPWHYFPGIPYESTSVKRWFENRGYVHHVPYGQDVDMICEYGEEPVPDRVSPSDATFSILKEEEKDDLLSFLHRSFPGRWEYEAIRYFEKGGDGSAFVVIKKDDRIIGFCRVNDPESPFIAQNVYWAPLFDGRLGGIGPLGVDRHYRKYGYGLAIVKEAVRVLRERNVDRIVIDWTGLTEFYGKLGYTTWKRYDQYKKGVDTK